MLLSSPVVIWAHIFCFKMWSHAFTLEFCHFLFWPSKTIWLCELWNTPTTQLCYICKLALCHIKQVLNIKSNEKLHFSCIANDSFEIFLGTYTFLLLCLLTNKAYIFVVYALYGIKLGDSDKSVCVQMKVYQQTRTQTSCLICILQEKLDQTMHKEWHRYGYRLGLLYPCKTVSLPTGLQACWCQIHSQVSDHLTSLMMHWHPVSHWQPSPLLQNTNKWGFHSFFNHLPHSKHEMEGASICFSHCQPSPSVWIQNWFDNQQHALAREDAGQEMDGLEQLGKPLEPC